MSKKKLAPAPIGGSSLLVIFGVLCLTVFALLMMSTVKADVRMADESVKATKQYYKADLEAEEILARLRAGEKVDGVVRDGDKYAYSCKVSDTQILSVVVEIKDGDYTIYQWKEMASEEWVPDETIKVWGTE